MNPKGGGSGGMVRVAGKSWEGLVSLPNPHPTHLESTLLPSICSYAHPPLPPQPKKYIIN